jgi:chaperonin GroEL
MDGYAEKIEQEKQKLSWNVVDESTFRARVRNVFNKVAVMMTNSLGPDGSNTVIEKFGDIHITKDGWNILKKIHFNDSIDNTILQLLVNIAAQVVIKVGDGSTSSIVAANELLKSIEAVPELQRVRPKQLIDSLSKIANNISAEILARSKKIDISTEEGLDEIYRLALVSTNGEHPIADMIRTIYRESGNPSIEYIKSRTNRSHYDIIDGYQAPISFMDNLYINNSDDGTCDITKPLILMFDHRIDKEDHFDKIISHVINVSTQANRRLVVIAPRYEDNLLKYIQTSSNIEIRSRQTTQVVYARASLVNNLFQDFYNDFSIMTGGQIIRENDMVEAFREREENEAPFNLDPYIGEVDKISIGGMNTTIGGFPQKNEGMYQIAVADAVTKYNKVEASNAELNVPNPDIYDLKKRVAKLKGKMGIIYVGGNSSLEKVANFDLVEDAVRASESAFNYGYNIGGNLIIPIVIKDLITQTEDKTEKLIYELFSEAFRAVFARVIHNKYFDWEPEAIAELVNNSVEQQKVYDLITDKYSADVINPSHTDIEITKAVTSIVALLMGANQFLSIQSNTEF